MLDKRYNRTEFSRLVGVSCVTLRKWEKNGRLIPYQEENGKKYYLYEQLNSIIKKSEDDIFYNGCNWVDLSDVDKDIRGYYDWKDASTKNARVPYYYNDHYGIITILGIKGHNLSIDIDGNTDKISCVALRECSLDKITGLFSFEYKYSVGDRIIEGKTDISITKLTRTDNGRSRAYEYTCNRCNQPNMIVSEYNIKGSGCCPVCHGNVIVEGVNDIATTDPWMVPFFIDTKLAKEYFHGNRTNKMQFVCPDCGRVRKKYMYIDTLYRTRSINCVCGDGFKFPNKFMYSVCEQLKQNGEIKGFENEFNDSWIGSRRFDFILYFNRRDIDKVIIEMDGGLGHGNKTRDKNLTPEDTKRIDDWKDEQANAQGISVIRIDATCSEKDFLKLNIINALSCYCCFDEINWDKADSFAISNLVKKVCIYYEKNKPITIDELAKECNIGQSTARRYVKKGEKFGWCIFDRELSYHNKYIDTKSHVKRMERLNEVCQYYEKHSPILASELAAIFNLNISTILSYLKDGEKLGYKHYDKEYSRERNKKQIRSVNGNPRKKSVLCFTKEKKFVTRYESVVEASKYYDVSASAIYNCCLEKGTSAGYIFRYEDDCDISY